MAHFAQVNNNNVVEDVIVLNNSDMLDDNGVEQESIGISFLNNLFGSFEGRWVQTSYSSAFRGSYASVGGTYSSSENIFKVPKPFDSWVWSTSEASWEAPVSKPIAAEDAFGFEIESVTWNEGTTSWDVASTPKAHYARYDINGIFDGTIVTMPLEYILSDDNIEDDELGIILAIDHQGAGDWRRALTPA